MNSAAEIPRLQVLLVEDNPDTANLVRQLLADICDVSHASHSDEAVQIAKRHTCDIVLMDINLGSGPDGADVMRDLRELDGYGDVPVVALTAYALPGDREKFLAEGFSSYLSKPFGPDELLQVISKHTRTSLPERFQSISRVN
jgi:CheY-like chemotaxis protein